MNNNFAEGTGPEDNLKVPFTITPLEWSELHYFAFDMRLSGFGVLFSGILLVALALYVVNVVLLWRRQRAISIYAIVMIAFVIFLLSVVPTSWWARYSPYLYFIPVLAVFMSFKVATLRKGALRKSALRKNATASETSSDESEGSEESVASRKDEASDVSASDSLDAKPSKPCRIYGYVTGGVLAALMMVNSCLFFLGHVTELGYSEAMRDQFEALSGSKINLFNEGSDKYYLFGGIAFDLEDFDIDYSIVPESEITGDKYATYYGRMLFAFPEDEEGNQSGESSEQAVQSAANSPDTPVNPGYTANGANARNDAQATGTPTTQSEGTE